jgi:hypothetical protein
MPTSVFFTIDTELNSGLHAAGCGMEDNFDLAIEGKTRNGAYGLTYQIEHMKQQGVKAIFFVDPLPALIYGIDVIKRIVDIILVAGHDVQLHTHTEWLAYADKSPVGGRVGNNISDFSLSDQVAILETAAQLLEDAGAPRAVAYRAGNFGINSSTLSALNQNGIAADFSFNAAIDKSVCNIQGLQSEIHPSQIDKMIEIPVTAFDDCIRGPRPAQICAISIGEMDWIMDVAAARNWPSLVIVSHSFELINRKNKSPHPVNIARFRHLCERLGQDRNFNTCSAADTQYLLMNKQGALPASNRLRTAARMAEQAIASWRYERIRH